MYVDVWYVTFSEPEHPRLLMCDVPENIADRLVDNLESDNLVLRAWTE